MDAGANVGLYTLWAKAAAAKAGVALTALAIEPDPINAARLRFNMEASGDATVAIATVALSARPGTVRIAASNGANRGTVRLAPAASANAVEVPASPLLDVVRAAGLQRVDAMKVDIEGSEIAVLTRFLADAPPSLLPSLLLVEVAQEEDQLLDLLVRHGYRLDRRVGINGILSRPKRDACLAEVRLSPSAGRPDQGASLTESGDLNRPASASAM
ncbi:MAG: FkbM family methyltransferase [Alphaproteobacteria bacterium]